MTNSKAISIRIPDELLEKIDLLAEEKYKSHKGTPNRSLVVLDAIVAYFDTLSDTSKIDTLSDSVNKNRIEELSTIVNTLSDNVSELMELRKIVFTLSDSVEKLVKSQPSKKDSKVKQLSTSDISDIDSSKPINNPDPQKKPIEVKAKEKSTELRETANGVETMTTTQLAARLKINNDALSKAKSRYKNDVDRFIRWSYDRDPEHFAWEFKSGSSLFYRAIPF
jgi:metal-responsive CopG/Arc/MetJ family transcriptional regulator